MEAAMEMARRVEDDLRSVEPQEKGGEKRKWEGPSGSSNKKKFDKRAEQKGKIALKCRRCGKMGHVIKDCRSKEVICYNCQEMGHFASQCPKPKVGNVDAGKRNEVPKAKGRAFHMVADDARRDDEVILGTFLVNALPAYVLFDSGASRSFVSANFCAKFSMPRSLLEPVLEVEVAVGKPITVREKFDSCSIDIDGTVFPVSLIPLSIGVFDVVIGMDWLSMNRAEIICSKKLVRIPLSEGRFAFARGKMSDGGLVIISQMNAHKCLEKGCVAFLACGLHAPKKDVDLIDVEVVRDYPDVFPNEFSGLPPVRGLEFNIDLIPG
ncbi:MAG TPA: hypothetical protein VIJ14_05305, partial [Rhabdochlamydiaceae bacterium]